MYSPKLLNEDDDEEEEEEEEAGDPEADLDWQSANPGQDLPNFLLEEQGDP